MRSSSSAQLLVVNVADQTLSHHVVETDQTLSDHVVETDQTLSDQVIRDKRFGGGERNDRSRRRKRIARGRPTMSPRTPARGPRLWRRELCCVFIYRDAADYGSQNGSNHDSSFPFLLELEPRSDLFQYVTSLETSEGITTDDETYEDVLRTDESA